MPTTENQKLAQELDKATKLKTYLVSDDPAIEALVEKYLAIIKETRNATRSHDSKYRDQLRILICNLVWVNTKKNQWIYQGRGKPTYRQTRYFSELTKAVFVDGILDTLVTLNLIEQKLGYKPKPEKEELVPSEPQKPRLTRIRAKGRLKADIKKISPHVINVDSSFGAEVILAKPEIMSIRDLKGKSIGVSRNSYLEYILSVALAGENISINDVTLIDIPSEKSVEALSKGKIDAVIAWGPFVETIIKNGTGHKIFDTSEILGISPNGYVFHRSFIEKRPGDVQAFVNVWYKTVNLIKVNPQEAFGIIADIYDKTTGEVQSYAQGEKLLDLRENLTAFSFGSGFASLHGTVRRINDFMIEKGIVKEQLDSTKFIDSRFIQALK